MFESHIDKTLNPHLNIIKTHEVLLIKCIIYLKKILNKDTILMLDIGGGKGFGKLFYDRNDIIYHALDLKSSRQEDKIYFMQGDITNKDLKLENKYDLIFTKDTFEHILNPWDATNNIKNNLVNNGLFIFMAPFSWRYHASPYDTYRYSHTGVQYLFERNNNIKKVISGYINYPPNKGFWKNKKDYTLNNNAIFSNNIETFYIGQKDDTYIFDKSVLDADYSWDHST